MIIFSGELLSKKNQRLLNKIYKYTMKINSQKARWLEVNVDFIYQEEMKMLNNKMRGIDETTDVLSFPNLEDIFNKTIKKANFKNDINPETKKVILGDIAINLNKAEEQSTEYGHSMLREICYLFVHGLLHLLGYDHLNELDKSLMRGQEELVLEKFNLKRN